MISEFLQDRAASLLGYLLVEQIHALMDEAQRPARLAPTGIGGVAGDRYLASEVVGPEIEEETDRDRPLDIWPPSRRNFELLPGVHQGEQVQRAFDGVIDTGSRRAPGGEILPCPLGNTRAHLGAPAR